MSVHRRVRGSKSIASSCIQNHSRYIVIWVNVIIRDGRDVKDIEDVGQGKD